MSAWATPRRSSPEGDDDGEWNDGHLIRRLTTVTSDCGSDEADSFAAVGFHLCNNEHPAAALTVDPF